jgi:hypothetical protein
MSSFSITAKVKEPRLVCSIITDCPVQMARYYDLLIKSGKWNSVEAFEGSKKLELETVVKSR